MEVPSNDQNVVSGMVVDAAFAVHRALGAGLLESIYQKCLMVELSQRGIDAKEQVALPIDYKGVRIEAGLRIDLVVAGLIVVEIKAVERLLAVHEAQVLTYLKLSGHRIGLLINFNVPLIKEGIRRFVL